MKIRRITVYTCYSSYVHTWYRLERYLEGGCSTTTLLAMHPMSHHDVVRQKRRTYVNLAGHRKQILGVDAVDIGPVVRKALFCSRECHLSSTFQNRP